VCFALVAILSSFFSSFSFYLSFLHVLLSISFAFSFVGDGAILSWDIRATESASATLVGSSHEPIHALARVTQQTRANVNSNDDAVPMDEEISSLPTSTTSDFIYSANRKGFVNVFAL
jgi:hypothetical protein